MPRLKYVKVSSPDCIVKAGGYYRLVPVAPDTARKLRRRRADG